LPKGVGGGGGGGVGGGTDFRVPPPHRRRRAASRRRPAPGGAQIDCFLTISTPMFGRRLPPPGNFARSSGSNKLFTSGDQLFRNG